MNRLTIVIQIIISVLLAVSILMQTKSGGLGSSFGGSTEQFRSKRGIEKLLHKATIVLALLFALTSLANVIFF